MVTLYYSDADVKITTWQDRLAKMAIKHRLKRQEMGSEPHLQYGDDAARGAAAIDAYLDQLEVLVKSWYEDRCDKYEC
jgi:hypothetical protein